MIRLYSRHYSIPIVVSFMIFSAFLFYSCKKKHINTKPDIIKSKKNMVYVPAGWFYMSVDTAGDKRKKVYLDAYYIDKFEVSNKDYNEFIRDGGYSNKKYWCDVGWNNLKNVIMPRWWINGRYNVGILYPNYPVAGISWYEASAYAKWAGKRLPTEAEWEKASRGTNKIRFPWGNENIEENGVFYANFETVKDNYRYSAPINSFTNAVSHFGCFNTLGNVWEWVSDWFPTYEYYSNMPLKNPKGIKKGTKKLLRGGSWFKDPSYYESFFRFGANPESRQYDDVGFRCVISAD